MYPHPNTATVSDTHTRVQPLDANVWKDPTKTKNGYSGRSSRSSRQRTATDGLTPKQPQGLSPKSNSKGSKGSSGAKGGKRSSGKPKQVVAIEDVITREKKRQAILAKAQEQAQAKFARNHNLENETVNPPAKMVVAYSKRLLRKLKPAVAEDLDASGASVVGPRLGEEDQTASAQNTMSRRPDSSRARAKHGRNSSDVSVGSSAEYENGASGYTDCQGLAADPGFDLALEGLSDSDDGPQAFGHANKLSEREESCLSSALSQFSWKDPLDSTACGSFEPIIVRTTSPTSSLSGDSSCDSPRVGSPRQRSLLTEGLRNEARCRSYSLYDGFAPNSTTSGRGRVWSPPPVGAVGVPGDSGTSSGFCKGGLPFLPDCPFPGQPLSKTAEPDVREASAQATQESCNSFDQLQYEMLRALELGLAETPHA